MTVFKLWLIVPLLLCSLFGPALQARELVVVFENSLQPSSSLDAMARAQMLVRNLKTAGVSQAMFLVQTPGLNGKDKARLALYSDQGHLLVNAGYSNSLVGKSDLYVYEVGLLKTHRLLQQHAGYKKHVHFAYLHEVGDSRIQTGLIDFLQERGYQPAFSYFNHWRGVDAYINQLYQQKIRSNRKVDMAALERAYVELMVQTLAQQDALAFNLLGYSPPQTLVLEANDVAAYFIVALLDELIAQGWSLMAAEKLLTDPLINPLYASGWGANSVWPVVTGLVDLPVAYPRVLGERKQVIDNFLQNRVPGFIE